MFQLSLSVQGAADAGPLCLQKKKKKVASWSCSDRIALLHQVMQDFFLVGFGRRFKSPLEGRARAPGSFKKENKKKIKKEKNVDISAARRKRAAEISEKKRKRENDISAARSLNLFFHSHFSLFSRESFVRCAKKKKKKIKFRQSLYFPVQLCVEPSQLCVERSCGGTSSPRASRPAPTPPPPASAAPVLRVAPRARRTCGPSCRPRASARSATAFAGFRGATAVPSLYSSSQRLFFPQKMTIWVS